MEGTEGIVGVIITCIVILMVLILSYWSSIKEWYDHYAEKRQKAEVGQGADGIAELLADLNVLRDKGRTLSGGLPAQKQERIKQVLHMSEAQWRQTCKEVSIDDIIDKLSLYLRVLRPLIHSRKEQTSTNIPEKASGEMSELRPPKDESLQDETPRTTDPAHMPKLEKEFGTTMDRRPKPSEKGETTELSEEEQHESSQATASDHTWTSKQGKQKQYQWRSASEKGSKQLDLSKIETQKTQPDSFLQKRDKSEARGIPNSDHMEMHSREDRFSTTDTKKFIDRLGLASSYPSKISLQDVMTVRKADTNHEHEVTSVPWLMLQKLVMVDFKARESELKKAVDKKKGNVKKQRGFVMDEFMDDLDGEDDNALNPLDVFLVTYACCDITLKQIIVQKLFSCRLAVPFITPQLSNESLLYSLWALRNITVEWKNKNQDCTESSVVSQAANIISFLRIGNPSQSKSVLLNNVISDQPHQTFWNRKCPLGETEKHIANGLVEAQWYLPSGKPDDIFEDVTMFLNLRGDACKHRKQLDLLSKISSVVVCCLESKDLAADQLLDTMRRVHNNSAKVILILSMKELDKATLKKQIGNYFAEVGTSYEASTRVILGCKGKKERPPENLKEEIRDSLQLMGQTGRSVEEASLEAGKVGVEIDENEECCQVGKTLALEIMQYLEGKAKINECKREMLPLQSKTSEKLSQLNKSKHKVGGKDETHKEIGKIKLDIKGLKEEQLGMCRNLSPLVRIFIRNLSKVIDSPAASLFLQWLKIYLDDLSRKTLPGLHDEYHRKWKQLKAFEREAGAKPPSQQTSSCDPNSDLKDELTKMETLLVESSLGVEHLFREIAQIYEATHKNTSVLSEGMVEKLPELAAKQLLKGQPLEIMDGDAANVPMTWIKAVFSSIKDLVGNKTVLVASVLGVQSSGKSTLLNTMFGLQFAVSAGRCTRGIYAQLIKVQRGDDPDLPEYILVCDTEGLRAPELGQIKHGNDNELATFVIGLGAVTIMNIKGENLAEMADVLQIVVHAFLRMIRSKNNFQRNRTCLFIHQNVAAVNARSKMQKGTKKLQENLDAMTKVACDTEKIVDIHTFNEVIKFDTEKNVWFFPDLWYGNPPMAPVNPEYTETVQGLRDHLLFDFTKAGQTFLTMSETIIHMNDLWEGVLAEDFVFSFRNCLEAKAYDELEKLYHEKSWDAENEITTWVNQTAIVQLQKLEAIADLDIPYRKLCTMLTDKGNDWKDKVCSELKEYFKSHTLKDILVQWETQKLRSLVVDIDTFIERAQQTLHQEKEDRRIHLLQKVKFAEIDTIMMRRAKSLAQEMKGKRATPQQLEDVFDKFWLQSVSELVPRNTMDPTPIAKTVTQLLFKRLEEALRTDLRKELAKNPLNVCTQITSLEDSFTINDVLEGDLSISNSLLQWVMNKVRRRHPKLYCREKAKQAIKSILKTVDTYLSTISQQDSDFHEIYATKIIKDVVDGIDKQNQANETGNSFTLLPNLKVEVVVHACRYAVKVFDKMRKQYREAHDISGQLNTKRAAYWGVFMNMVQNCENAVIAADLLLAHLEVLVKRSVRKAIILNVVDEIGRFFGKQKHTLLVEILEDLTKESFEKNRSFLHNAKMYSLSWLTSFTNKQIFSKKSGTKSKYIEFAETEISRLLHCIEEGITATENRNPINIYWWMKTFCDTTKGLPVTEEDLSHIEEYDIKDLKDFQELLMNRLPRLRDNILRVMNSESPHNVRWEGTSPYTQILDRLWGCEALCPFCKEVCQRADVNHPGISHQCIQHRPKGVGGCNMHTDQTLVLDSCSFSVQSTKIFKSSKLKDNEYHPYKEYKKYFPDWEIAPSPNMESSKYWLWFMAKYKVELAEWYNAEVPDIPEHWDLITAEEAVLSLSEHYG